MAPCPRWKQRPLATAAVCWVLVVALLTARPASAQGNGNGNNGNPADLALRRAMWPYINNNCTMDMTTSPYRLMLDSVQNSTTNATTRFCFATAAGPAISNMSIADGGEGQLVDGAPACAVRLYANLFEIDLGIQPSCGANITNVTLNGLPWPYDIVYPPTFNVTTGMFANGTNLTSSARLAAFRLSKIRLAYQYASHLVVCMNVSAPCNRLPVLVNNSASRLQTSFVESGNKRCCPITEAPLPPPNVIPMPPSPPQPPAPPSPPQLTLAYSRSFVAVIYANYSQLALGDNNDATRMQEFMYDYRDAVAYALAITSDQVIITSISNGNTNPSTIVVGTTVAARSQQELNLLNVLLTFMALYPPRAFGTSFFANYNVDHIVITIAPPSPSPPPTPPPNPFPPPSPSPSPPPAPPSPSPEPPSPPVPPPSPSPPVPPPSPDPSPPPSPPDFPSPPSPPSPIPPSPPSSPIPIVPTPVPVFTPAPTVAPVYPPTYPGPTPSGGRRRILHAGARSKEDLRGMAQRHAWGVDVRNIRKQLKQRRA